MGWSGWTFWLMASTDRRLTFEEERARHEWIARVIFALVMVLFAVHVASVLAGVFGAMSAGATITLGGLLVFLHAPFIIFALIFNRLHLRIAPRLEALPEMARGIVVDMHSTDREVLLRQLCVLCEASDVDLPLALKLGWRG